jgi:hypothetical protein
MHKQSQQLSMVSVTITIGKKMVRKYLSNMLKQGHVGPYSERPKYSVWYDT